MSNYTKILLMTIIICAGIINTAAAQSRRSSRSQQALPVEQMPPESEQAPSMPVLSQCPDRSQWEQMTSAQRRGIIWQFFKIGAETQNISDDCFYTMVSGLSFVDKKLLKDSLNTIFSSRFAKGQFSLELLFSLFRISPLVNDSLLWGAIIDMWVSASEHPVYVILASNNEGVRIPIADTLYMALDAAPNRLSDNDLLRYGRIKSLRGDYRAAARIYCRAASSPTARLEHAAMTQMGQLFADVDSAGKAAALGDFSRCIFAVSGTDTAFFRNWLADYYGRHGLFEQEIDILTAFNLPAASSGRRLSDAARNHFTHRRYRHAATAAAALSLLCLCSFTAASYLWSL